MLIQRCNPGLFKVPSRFQNISVLLTTSVRNISTAGATVLAPLDPKARTLLGTAQYWARDLGAAEMSYR